MKKTLSILAVGTLLVSFAASAHAASYNIFEFVDFEPTAGFQNTVLVGETKGVVVDLVAQSAWSGIGEEITSATLAVSLLDPRGVLGPIETVSILLDGNFWKSPADFIAATVGGSINVSLLNDDNKLSIELQPVGGPVQFSWYSLSFDTGPKTQPVPDGGFMMALLGLSVLGLGWASRRVRV